MSETTEKTKVGTDDAATKTKHAAEKVAETSKPTAGETGHSKSNAADDRGNGLGGRMKPVDNKVDAAAEKGSELASGARAFAECAVEKSREAYNQLVDHAHEGVRQAGAIVRANPVSTITLAFAAGIGAGLLIGLSPRRKKERWSFMR